MKIREQSEIFKVLKGKKWVTNALVFFLVLKSHFFQEKEDKNRLKIQ